MILSDASPLQADKLRGFPPCYAVAVSGLPPREQLFNGSLCHDGGALLSMKVSQLRRQEGWYLIVHCEAVSSKLLPGGNTTTDPKRRPEWPAWTVVGDAISLPVMERARSQVVVMRHLRRLNLAHVSLSDRSSYRRVVRLSVC